MLLKLLSKMKFFFVTDVKTVQALMGHANYETTMDIYTEISDMKKKEVMNNLGTMTDFF